jgi:thymidylate synthase
MVAKSAKIWDSIRNEEGLVFSNYGYWWIRGGQYEKMIQLMSSNIKTRRAILVHYSPDEVSDFSKDTPCNVVLNFHVEDDMRLNLTIFARSIDLVYGFCNDQYCFSRLMWKTAQRLGGLPIGTMHYFITDLHIYEKHYNLKFK